MKSFISHRAIWAIKIFKTKFATLGILICWDQWYPEAARITALMGAEVLFYPTAIGWATSQDEATNTEQYNAWQTIQRSHAVANGSACGERKSCRI
jgi:N-carbamoylputrescine amidase